jgi:hypothetical protein
VVENVFCFIPVLEGKVAILFALTQLSPFSSLLLTVIVDRNTPVTYFGITFSARLSLLALCMQRVQTLLILVSSLKYDSGFIMTAVKITSRM